MRIATSQLYSRPASLMAQLTAQADKVQTQIATGKRIQTASEDPATWLRLQGLKQQTANDGAYAANIDMAQGLLDQTDTALDSVESQLQRALELATQAKTGTLSDANRKAVSEELNAIRDSLFALANTKDVRGQPLFGGATGDVAYVEAADGTISFAGTGEPSPIPIGEGIGIQAGVTGPRAFAAGSSDIFAVIGAFADALDAGGDVKAAGEAALNGINASIETVGLARASVGARAARLELDADRLVDAGEARETTRKSLEETDIPTAATELQKTLTILQATQASFTKLTSLSLFDYLK
ncbi:flagellar hook-associated protein 3 FlgL [Sphingomonas naasensis]|uniref:Flagellar hook-associated protein 3 n=1 Tax=Sphingomonas naasensis TaxID=1344951 RepID=A0A4S1W8T0_9SPHN|nr:flagellar hook-associated protein FlgL [Sphingomonas naasensis]NIJ21197.1 flagellar hook-associated protein 3 FlgL [Sphingomonas naasensis]TGX38225.1 flagellar hook-associated protein 3 [Sphingomonas naasensis]